MRTPVSIGVAGLGARGQALVLALDASPAAELRWIFDQSPQAMLSLKRRVHYARAGSSFEDLLADEGLDAIAIATPASTHCQLARRALDAGKHVLVENPLALTAEDARALVARAHAGSRRLMACHQLSYLPAARRLQELLAEGRLGEIYYLWVSRQGLGSRREEGVLWEAAAALALAVWLVGDEPIEASASGGAFATGGRPDVAFCHLRFATGIETELRLSRLEARETRQLAVVGSRGMAVLDELDAERPLTLYERGAGGEPADARDREALTGRGEIVCPRLVSGDSLRSQCDHFLALVRSGTDARVAAREAAVVVEVVQALERSLERRGTPEPVGAAGNPPVGVIRLPLRS